MPREQAVDKASHRLDVQRSYRLEVLEVRGRAAEVLAAVGARKLRVIALFRAAKWAAASTANHENDQPMADLNWIRATEWHRIGCAL
jgi:hypothetical protein